MTDQDKSFTPSPSRAGLAPDAPDSPEPAKPAGPPPWRLTLLVISGAVVLAGIVLAIVSVLHRAPPPSRARSIGARLDLAAGDVAVTEQEGSPAAKALSGAPLAIGSHVATGKGARALVRTGDGAAVFLRAETEIVLLEHGIELESGEAWLDAPRVEGSSIDCKVAGDTISASDAGLSITRAGDDVTVYVARGLAILTSAGGRAEVNAGEQGTAHAKDAPKIAPVAFWQDWTGGMADGRPVRGAAGSGSGRIYGVNVAAPQGSAARPLGIARQSVHAVLRDGVAETEVNQTFSNPSSQQVEGWYWFTVPPQATVVSFSLETNGVLVEGEVVEKQEAAARYTAAVRQAQDPALLEWVDGRSYRARIFPIPASGTRRVVLRYMELLPTVEAKTRYVYPLRSDDPVRFDEFALSVDLGDHGPELQVATSEDATLEPGGRLVTMRRSGYVPEADFQLEMTQVGKPKPPLRVWRFAAGSDQADYVMLRYTPDIDFASLPPQKASVVLVVDTSASGDESARQLRVSEAEAILRALSDDDRFALVALDVAPTVLYPDSGLEAATDANVAAALEKLSDHATGGATDLGSMFEPALERLHGTEQPAIVYVGDGAPTSGETTPDGLTDRMRRSLSGSRARFFAVGVGEDARHPLLAELARAGGGQALRVDEADQTTGEALELASAIKTPTLTDVEVNLSAALDQPFFSATGKLSRGEELVLLARTHHALPAKVTIKGHLAGKDISNDYPVAVESSVVTGLVPRLWAAEYVRRLLGTGASDTDNRAKVLDLGLEYGLLTPYTSILALDSDAAYARQGDPRRAGTPLRGVRLTSLDGHDDESALAMGFSGETSLGGCSKREDSAERQASPVAATAAASAYVDTPAPNDNTPSTTTSPAPHKPGSALITNDKGGVAGDTDDGRFAGDPAATATAGAAAPAKAVPANAPVTPVAKTLAQRGAMKEPAPPPMAPPMGASAGLGRAGGQSSGAGGDTGLRRDHAGAATNDGVALDGLVANQTARAVHRPLGACSDAASRTLAERIVLWRKRLARVNQAQGLVNQYDGAHAACELPDWRDEQALLDLIEVRITTEQAAELFLGYLAGEPDAERYVARAILRRTVDPRLEAAVARVLFGGKVDWAKVDRELADLDKPQDREAHLRAAMLVAPGDPAGDVRLVKLLAQNGERDDALAYGRRLRDRGLLTPALAQELGDVLADAGQPDEALRTYSEVVEFDADDPSSRRLLGDIFLRQGWYPAAYRQYKTLTDLDPKSATSWLRLAAAAAGTGRVDEAFRIEHDVAAGEGSPGPDDPRYWARLWSAARLGTLLADPTKLGAAGGDGAADGIARRLKQLQLWSGPGTLSLLTWEDLEARLVLGNADDKNDGVVGEANDAGPTGLYAVFAQTDAWQKNAWAVRWKADAEGRAVKFSLVTLTWDGKAFSVAAKTGQIAAAAVKQTL